MGLVSFSTIVAATALTAQLPQPQAERPRAEPAAQRQAPKSARAYTLPAAPDPAPREQVEAAQRRTAYPRIEAPAADPRRITLPEVSLGQGSAAIKMKMVGLHFGWDF